MIEVTPHERYDFRMTGITLLKFSIPDVE